MLRRIGVFGTAGMAREVRDIALDLGISVVFVALNKEEAASFCENEDVILEEEIDRYTDMPYAIGIGDNVIRRNIVERFSRKVNFLNLIHPTVSFGKGQRQQVEGRSGVILCAGVRLTSNVSMGDFTICNLNATVSHDTIIGNFVTICPHACILGNAEIKCGAWVGAGAIINQGTYMSKTTIGENTIIGSGAIVVENCDSNSTYVGVPARKIK